MRVWILRAGPAVKAGVVTGGPLQNPRPKITHAGMSADAVRAMAEARDAGSDSKKTE